MKYLYALIFFGNVFYYTAQAQFKNIEIAEITAPQNLMIAFDAKDRSHLFATCNSSLYMSSDSGFTWKNKIDQGVSDSLLKNTSCKGPNNENYNVFVDGNELKFKINDNTSSHTYTIAAFKNGARYLVNGKWPANGLPNMACDASGGEHTGRIYVCWSDEKYGETNKDVFLAYSDDKGANWTEPILVTYRPNHKEQFMPYLTVDQSSGFVYVIYYDQQNSADNKFLDVYLARSKNGGLLFDLYKMNDRPLELRENGSFSRMGLAVSNSVIRPLWIQNNKKGNNALYTAIVDENVLAHYGEGRQDNLSIEKTFTFTDQPKIDFELKKNMRMTAVITNPLDHRFEKMIFKNKKMRRGHNSLLIDYAKFGIPKGSYTLTLYYDHKNAYVWLIAE